MSKDLVIAGTNLNDFGVVISGEGVYNAAERDVETVSVAGRNGDLTYDMGRYKNIPVKYPASIARNFPENAEALRAFLSSLTGYQRIEDGYYPDLFRLGRFVGPLEFSVGPLGRTGEMTLKFDCKPQRFLESGEFPVTLKSDGSIFNPTQFPALPLIRVYGYGDGSITVGDTTVEIKAMEDTITLDCETMDAYHEADSGALESRNSIIYAPYFPELLPGENAVDRSGGVTIIEFIPRWWTL